MAVVAALVCAACSDAPDSVTVAGSDPDPAVPPDSESVVPADADASEDDLAATADTVPGTRPETPVDGPLAPADALLRPADVGGEWQAPSDGAYSGGDVGPNQTDCDPYWTTETVASSAVASRFWFQPGANLFHEVFDAGPKTAVEVMAAARSLPDTCPVLRWLEGGTLAITTLPVDLPGVVALELISDAREIEWVAYAHRSNLVSRLRRVHFGTNGNSQPSGDAFREFGDLALAMVERLEGGGAPSVPVPELTDPSVDPVEPLPPVDPQDAPPAREPVEAHPLLPALLTVDDLLPGWTIEDPSAHSPGDPDDQRIADCEESEAVVLLDEWFALEVTVALDNGFEGLQLVGRAPSVEAAAAAVADFGLIAGCDPMPLAELVDLQFGGGPIEGVTGATVTMLEMRSTEPFVARFMAYHVDELVGVLLLGSDEGIDPPYDDHVAVLQSAVDRAVAVMTEAD